MIETIQARFPESLCDSSSQLKLEGTTETPQRYSQIWMYNRGEATCADL